VEPFKLFRGQLSHARKQPVQHAFSYQVCQVWVHLNQLAELNQLSRWWSTSRFNLVRFDRRQYLPSEKPLLEEVYSIIKQQTGKDFNADVYLLGNVSYWGHCYNPACFYACYQNGTLQFLMCEIHNTPWGERFCYVHEVEQGQPDAFQEKESMHVAHFDKQFHVSPFMPMNLQYEWRYTISDKRIRIVMNLFENTQPVFNSTLLLQGETLTQKLANRMPFVYPFMCLKVLCGIYWQATKLFFKRAPIHAHPDKR